MSIPINIGDLSINIHYYSIAILIAILIGGKLAINEAKRGNLPEDFMFNTIFWMLIWGILGARLYYVIFNFDYYSSNPGEILKIWHGGLAIHGGIIASLIFVYFYTKKYQVKFITILDILAPSLLIAQAIGRWGNFFNGEAHGGPVTLDFLNSLHIPEFIINGMYINGTYYLPTFLMESIWCLIGFIIIILIRKSSKCKIGTPLSFYLIWYGIGRFIIEAFRTDSLMLGSLKMAQIVSIIMILIGIIILIMSNKKNDNLYNNPENNYKINY